MVCLSPNALSKVYLRSCLSLHTQIASTAQSAWHIAGARICLEQTDRLTAPPHTCHAGSHSPQTLQFLPTHPRRRFKGKLSLKSFPVSISLPNGPEDAAIHLQGPGFGRLCHQHHDTALPPRKGKANEGRNGDLLLGCIKPLPTMPTSLRTCSHSGTANVQGEHHDCYTLLTANYRPGRAGQCQYIFIYSGSHSAAGQNHQL